MLPMFVLHVWRVCAPSMHHGRGHGVRADHCVRASRVHNSQSHPNVRQVVPIMQGLSRTSVSKCEVFCLRGRRVLVVHGLRDWVDVRADAVRCHC